MQRIYKSLLAIAIVTTSTLALVMVGHRNVAQAGDDGCNASTVKGAYGFAIGGLVSTTFNGNPQLVGEFVPLAAPKRKSPSNEKNRRFLAACAQGGYADAGLSV